MTKARVLIIEDDPDGRRSVVDAVEDGGFSVTAVATGQDGIDLFADGEFDVVLSDLVLPDIDGISVLEQIRKQTANIPVIIITAYGTVSSSVRAMKSGAYDYITKPLDLDDLQSKLARAVETSQLRGEVNRLRKSVKSRHTAESMIAADDRSVALINQIKAVVNTTATVLIQGESGTGKELVAQALHYESERANNPFVAVNCGALTESLLESELFGHEKGSFTGATRRHRGAFERADSGTLFLDEVGNAPMAVQIKLLRVLEQREITRIGGQDTFNVNVRVISASNRSLEDLVEEGSFRDDLLYRLKVVTLDIPPLRERRKDIRPLAERFITNAAEDHGRNISEIEEDYFAALESYDWPGNIRQLRNLVESSVVLSTSPALSASVLQLPNVKPSKKETFVLPENMSLAGIEKETLLQALTANEGNRTLTAERLGLSRRTIQRKIKEHDLPF